MWVNTELFSPVVSEGLPPRDSIYYESFWVENRKNILDGYEVGGRWISGDHYWYLNFWPIRGLNHKTGRKGIINPRFLDMDAEYFYWVDQARKQQKGMTVVKARQKGFEQPDSEPVLTKEGWKPIGQIKKGDFVYTPKNSLSKVIDVFPQGTKDVYKVEFMDGRTVRCGINHLWKVY